MFGIGLLFLYLCLWCHHVVFGDLFLRIWITSNGFWFWLVLREGGVYRSGFVGWLVLLCRIRGCF